MIGRLEGKLLEKEPPFLLIDVQGVGYELQAPMTTFYDLPPINDSVVLYTHLAISETSHHLYGFRSQRDRYLFRLLIKVSGVGPKMALGVMSGMESDEFVRAVHTGNLAALTKLPGVGKKTAERLLVEMRDRLSGWSDGVRSSDAPSQTAEVQVSSGSVIQAEAESALLALGYKQTEATRAIRGILDKHSVESCEELIRLSLRSMMPKL